MTFAFRLFKEFLDVLVTSKWDHGIITIGPTLVPQLFKRPRTNNNYGHYPISLQLINWSFVSHGKVILSPEFWSRCLTSWTILWSSRPSRTSASGSFSTTGATTRPRRKASTSSSTSRSPPSTDVSGSNPFNYAISKEGRRWDITYCIGTDPLKTLRWNLTNHKA